MKKLVIVHPAYWEQSFGGAELQISYLSDYALSKDWEVHYVYEDKKTPIKNLNKINLHPISPLINRNTLGFRFALCQKQIINALTEIKPDVIYTRCAFSWSGIAAKYAKRNRIKHIWAIASDNDPLAYQITHHDFLKPLNVLEKLWIKYAIKNASLIISQNLFQQKLLHNIHLRESIRISQMAPEEKKIIKKDYIKLKILWVANLKSIKRPEIFIRLSDYFAARQVDFIMIGKPDPKYDSLISNARNLQYMGSLPNESVNKMLCKSHLLINTSISEGFSNTFIQAWLRKVPVISMNSNPDEIITNQNAGRICNTEESLRLTINELISEPAKIQEMGENAFNYATKNHSITNLLPNVYKLLTTEH